MVKTRVRSMARGEGRNWKRLAQDCVLTMKEGRAIVKSCMDQGSGCCWKRAPSSGDGRTSYAYQCLAHAACDYWVRVIWDAEAGAFGFEESGEHSSKPNQYTRKNSVMTISQEMQLAASMVGGGRPAGMRTAMTLGKEKDLQKMGLDPNSQKRQEGGLKGEHREREAVSSVQQRLVYPHLYSNSIL